MARALDLEHKRRRDRAPYDRGRPWDTGGPAAVDDERVCAELGAWYIDDLYMR